MILGIESSCDESALAVFSEGKGVTNEWVHSQIDLHRDYGGVVPDLASREHLRNFPVLLKSIPPEIHKGVITRIAVTRGPGLAGCLAIGVSLAKALSFAWSAPIQAVNHLRAHAWSPFIPLYTANPRNFSEEFEACLPHLGLLVSGGNTLLFSITSDRHIRVLAETVDDAAGEALDKGAKLLGFPYPGGARIEKEALGGDSTSYDFPRAFSRERTMRFSFSGLKTSLRYRLEKMTDHELESNMPHICAAYQQAVIDALMAKTSQALDTSHFRSLGLSGGVANNSLLRTSMEDLGKTSGLPVFIAEKRHTGDNAAMVAFAAYVEELFTGNSCATATAQIEIAPSLSLESA